MGSSNIQSAWKIIPQFYSHDIQSTVDFYTKELGFELGGINTDDAGQAQFCSVAVGTKAAANIYFHRHDTAEAFASSSAMIALGTVELDKFYEEVKDKEAVKVAESVENKPWGYRQFTLQDPDGNKLTFFKFLEGGNPGDA